MESDRMIHRANQIALFFAGYPHDEAVAGVTDHFKKFWERRMRDQIIQYVAHGGSGLHELALEAVKRLQ
jgi:formate dehydrogenase subunit delta